jgi:hypothetical protein
LFLKGRGRLPKAETRFLWLWAVVTLGFSVGVALLGLKAFNPRYVAIVLPAWIVLLNFGILEGLKTNTRLTRVGIAILVGLMLLGGARQQLVSSYHREDMRGAAKFSSALYQEGDVIVVQGASGPFERYYLGSAPLKVFHRNYLWDLEEGNARLKRMVEGSDRVIWVGSRLWYIDPLGYVPRWLGEDRALVQQREMNGVEIKIFALDQRDPTP